MPDSEITSGGAGGIMFSVRDWHWVGSIQGNHLACCTISSYTLLLFIGMIINSAQVGVRWYHRSNSVPCICTLLAPCSLKDDFIPQMSLILSDCGGRFISWPIYNFPEPDACRPIYLAFLWTWSGLQSFCFWGKNRSRYRCWLLQLCSLKPGSILYPQIFPCGNQESYLSQSVFCG